MKHLVLLSAALALTACANVETTAEKPKAEPEISHVVAYTSDSVTLRMWNSWEDEEAATEAALVCGKTGRRAELIGDSQAPTPTYSPYAGLYGGSSYRYEHDFVFACLPPA